VEHGILAERLLEVGGKRGLRGGVHRAGRGEHVHLDAAEGVLLEDVVRVADGQELGEAALAVEDQDEVQPSYSLKEFGFTSFKRSFTLPETIELEAITAQYEQGILQLDIPKKDSAKINTHRLIEIN
jgi:HSP20 family protein